MLVRGDVATFPEDTSENQEKCDEPKSNEYFIHIMMVKSTPKKWEMCVVCGGWAMI